MKKVRPRNRSRAGQESSKRAPRTRKTRSTVRTLTSRAVRRVRESDADRQARARRLLGRLRAAYPHATSALRFENAYQLLVATILSAQCTDERVNQVTPDVFRRWPDPQSLASADPAELEAAIRSTGFFRNKARSLLGMARQVCTEFGGRIPDTMEELLRLPGVARKTANCVLGTWYRKNVGIVVDTHVGRLAERMGLAPSARNSKDAERIERDLMTLFPQDTWTWLAHALMQHGRTICTARKPQCDRCPLAPDCPSAGQLG
jgi:endonuclease-3